MDNTYLDGDLYICADCGHEWPQQGGDEATRTPSWSRTPTGRFLVTAIAWC
ncbi:hypothetical protein [Allochromatium palmeri]|uniref:hypothetical protein n=1 Tax=Allochromatium palmeri TaxID=231048 RepID=UPI001CA3F41E